MAYLIGYDVGSSSIKTTVLEADSGTVVASANSPKKEMEIIARRPGWAFTRYQIVDAARGEDSAVTDRSVDVQIVGLRKKLGNLGKYIETVRNVGYRFRD